MKQFISIMILSALLSCSNNDPMKKALELKPLPSFSLLLPDSTTWINTTSIPEGKPIVMFLFSPHCPYCRTQMEDIKKNISQLKDIQLYLVTSFPVRDIKDFYSEYQLAGYSNIVVGRDTANLAVKYFKLPGVPFTAVFGKDKQPSKFFLGVTQTKDIQKAAVN